MGRRSLSALRYVGGRSDPNSTGGSMPGFSESLSLTIWSRQGASASKEAFKGNIQHVQELHLHPTPAA